MKEKFSPAFLDVFLFEKDVIITSAVKPIVVDDPTEIPAPQP